MGLLIVAVSVLVGARVLGSADDTVEVWAADADLVAGSTLSADDLVAVRVRFRDGESLDSYLPASEPPEDGARLARDVGAGELLPAAALGEGEDEGLRHVPVAVEATRVPPGVVAGSVVDVWAAGAEVPADAGTSATTQPGQGAAQGPAQGQQGTGAPDPSAPGAVLLLEEVRVVEAPSAQDGIGSLADRQLVLAVPEDQHDAIGPALAAMTSGTVTVAQRG
ncbi:hypothetical protein [Nocardioides sp. ChNu-99]|uniref:hypothetical protein n=1 Tax=Nocardioides sp. ChNu-99 TaxID=2839897 RepID=UPI002405D970|nr:hypothetical protein [Nocardioides sp. ChNu-99]MDF9716335.1 hypothetical protein [Nocardioides sp. ChNu-99]